MSNTAAPNGEVFILRLPDELLVKIFQLVASGRNPDYHKDKQDHNEPHVDPSIFLHHNIPHDKDAYDTAHPEIAAARLTCRRFSRTSSSFLMSHVRVYLTPASLRRLEAISRHPAIGRGIRHVQVNLSYYDGVVAHDIRRFAGHAHGSC